MDHLAGKTIQGAVPQRIDSCLSIMDRFLQSDQAVVSSFIRAHQQETNQRDTKGDLFESICRILSVKDTSTLHPDSTLESLALDSLMSIELKQLLERHSSQIFTSKADSQFKNH